MTAATAPHKDPVQKVLGCFGKYQLRAMLIIFLCKMPTSWFMAILMFTALAPEPGDVHCTPPPSLPANRLNDWINGAHPKLTDRHNGSRIDYCHVYKEIMDAPIEWLDKINGSESTYNFTAIKCRNFTFAPDYHSIAAGFNLVCDRQMLVSLSQCFHILGLLLGGIVAYFLMK